MQDSFFFIPTAIRIANKHPNITIYGKENIDNYTCIPLKNVAGENNRFLIARVRESERERERAREERGREIRLRINHIQTRFLLFCVNIEAITSEGVKEDKRQHKYDASQK